jgi:hypothetical protein
MEIQTATLTEFLLARIAEDEARVRVEGIHPGGPDGLGSVLTDWEERRWLAECEAKRRIVSRCDMVLRGREEGMFDEGRATDARDNLRALALPYVDHPDFREEWRV